MATKKCPFCAEEIQAEAIFCRFCRSRLDTAPPTAADTAAPVQPSYGVPQPSYAPQQQAQYPGSQPPVMKAPDPSLRKAEILFDFDSFSAALNEMAEPQRSKTLEAFKDLCGALNTSTAEEMLSNLFNLLRQNNNKDFAGPDYNNALFSTAMSRIYSIKRPDEQPLIYCDEGIFSKGKCGYMITNQRFIKINKNGVLPLELTDIYSATKLTVVAGWFLNGNTNYKMSGESSYLLAVICDLCGRYNRAFEGSGYKISINIESSSSLT